MTAFLIDGSITKLQNRLPSLKAFGRDFSTDRYKPRATAQLKLVTAAGTGQKNAVSFESGDATVAPVSITVDQYTTAAHVTNDQLNSGLRMENLIDVKVGEFGDILISVALTPVTEANFKNYNGGSYISAPAAFGWPDMSLLWGALKKATEPMEVAKKYGWDGLHLNTKWDGATVNVGSGGTASPGPGTGCRGFLCSPQAVAIAAGLPLSPPSVPGQTLMESTFLVPGLGLSVATYSWFSLSSRTMWVSWDVMLGSQAADTSAGIFLKAS